MAKRLGKYFILLLAISSLLFTVSCAKPQVKPEPPQIEEAVIEEAPAVVEKVEEVVKVVEEEIQEEIVEEGPTEEELRKQALAEREAALREKFVKEDIHFEFDKSTLLLEAKEILKEKAEWLSMNPHVTVTLEGHCDERGTNEYNLALGDRRAESAKSFLIDLGISAKRFTAVSYGEERPLDPRHNEEAWAKNRRDHFVID